MPTLIGLMAAVGILRASGFLDFISGLLENFTGRIGFPGELVPLTIVKMFSSSAATGLLLDIFKQFGTDSRLGMIASISLSCTETIFYTMSVYFMTAGIKKIPLHARRCAYRYIRGTCRKRPPRITWAASKCRFYLRLWIWFGLRLERRSDLRFEYGSA